MVIGLGGSRFGRRVFAEVGALVRSCRLVGRNRLVTMTLSNNGSDILALRTLGGCRRCLSFSLITVDISRNVRKCERRNVSSTIGGTGRLNIELIRGSFGSRRKFTLSSVCRSFGDTYVPYNIFEEGVLGGTTCRRNTIGVTAKRGLSSRVRSFLVDFTHKSAVGFSGFNPRLSIVRPGLIPEVGPL